MKSAHIGRSKPAPLHDFAAASRLHTHHTRCSIASGQPKTDKKVLNGRPPIMIGGIPLSAMFAMNMKNKTVIILLVVGLASSLCRAERPENELPMYGGKHNPDVEQNKEFSASAAKLGWQYYYRGDLDTAIKRFNQAWMFDRESADAFWGFGLIMGRRSDKEDAEQNLRESIRFLEMAASRQTNNPNILVDLGYSRTGLGVLFKDKKDPASTNEFRKARAAFEQAERLNPDLPPVHSNWSVLEFWQCNYQKAQERLDRATKLGFNPDPAYVKTLEDKLKK